MENNKNERLVAEELIALKEIKKEVCQIKEELKEKERLRNKTDSIEFKLKEIKDEDYPSDFKYKIENFEKEITIIKNNLNIKKQDFKIEKNYCEKLENKFREIKEETLNLKEKETLIQLKKIRSKR